MEQGTGCAGSGRMSKVVAEDERETCTFLTARGRFLLCNRGTQLGTMCWSRASSEPGFMTKTRERPPRPGEKEKERRAKRRRRRRRRRRKRRRERFYRGLFALFDVVAILW